MFQACKCHMGWRSGCVILFDNSTKMSFAKVIYNTHKVNLEMWKFVQHAMCTLMGSPYTTWLHLKNVTKGKHRFSIVGAYEIGVVRMNCQKWLTLHLLT
jgi:hypothetical protein